jgi:hypothetical protein
MYCGELIRPDWTRGITSYQEWQTVGDTEVMIGRHGVQDEVQGVGIVKNNSLPGVAGSG